MSSGKSIMTFMDEKAPPKNIRIVEGSDNASIVISWDAPCPILENPIGYNVRPLSELIFIIHTSPFLLFCLISGKYPRSKP